MNIFEKQKITAEDFELEHIAVGQLHTNVYFLWRPSLKACLIVDPGDEADEIIRFVSENGLQPEAILLTHGHFDHLMAADTLRKHYSVPVCCYETEAQNLEKGIFWRPADAVKSLKTDRSFRDGETVNMAGLSFTVLHTPGHTAGGCCYYFKEQSVLISGDTLFQLSYGRTDLISGSDGDMLSSIRRLLTELPGDTFVYPGHGGHTMIEFEKRYNPLADMI